MKMYPKNVGLTLTSKQFLELLEPTDEEGINVLIPETIIFNNKVPTQLLYYSFKTKQIITYNKSNSLNLHELHKLLIKVYVKRRKIDSKKESQKSLSPKNKIGDSKEESNESKILNSKVDDIALVSYNNKINQPMNQNELDKLMNERANSNVWENIEFIQSAIFSKDSSTKTILIQFSAPLDKINHKNEINYNYPVELMANGKDLPKKCLFYCFEICKFISKAKRKVNLLGNFRNEYIIFS